MKNYLDQVLEASKSTSATHEVFDAMNDIKNGDKQVAVCSQRVKAMMYLVRELTDNLDDCLVCLQATNKKKESKEYWKWNGEEDFLKKKIRSTGDIMWIFIHEDNPHLIPIDHLFIRKSGVIVQNKNPTTTEKIIQGLLEMIMTKQQFNLHGNN